MTYTYQPLDYMIGLSQLIALLLNCAGIFKGMCSACFNMTLSALTVVESHTRHAQRSLLVMVSGQCMPKTALRWHPLIAFNLSRELSVCGAARPADVDMMVTTTTWYHVAVTVSSVIRNKSILL